MSDAEQTMSKVWHRIISEVRRMREEKYTLERIGSILGVSKPTVQRLLENNAGGEKTAFIDILRYLKALNIDLKGLLFEDETEDAKAQEQLAVQRQGAELAASREENAEMASELLKAQRELLQAHEKIINLQDKIIGLEKYSAEVADKARRIVAAVTTKKTENGLESAAKRRLSPSLYPDLPPIHLQNDDD